MDAHLKPAFVAWENLLLPREGGKAALQSILSAYGAPGRYYHTIEHIAEMTLLLAEYRALLPAYENTLYACLWHDFVYDAHRSDNEEQSIVHWRVDAERLQIHPGQITRVADLIRATAKHQPSDDSLEMRLFLDADLAILGASHTRYATYAEGVRREYAHVPDTDYCTGRSAVLRKFTDRPQLYFTVEMQNRFEKQARANVAKEIHNLENRKA